MDGKDVFLLSGILFLKHLQLLKELLSSEQKLSKDAIHPAFPFPTTDNEPVQCLSVMFGTERQSSLFEEKRVKGKRRRNVLIGVLSFPMGSQIQTQLENNHFTYTC